MPATLTAFIDLENLVGGAHERTACDGGQREASATHWRPVAIKRAVTAPMASALILSFCGRVIVHSPSMRSLKRTACPMG